MNKWNIPESLEREIIARDTRCVYCGVEFLGANESRKNKPSWEHIRNDAKIVTRANIARCCIACNVSKGAKLLVEWLESNYCKKRGITRQTVAEVVRTELDRA